MSIYDKGLSTDFYPYGVDGRGSQISAKNRVDFVRWRKWNNRNKIADSSRRNFSKAFNELDKMCSQLQLPKTIKDDAAVMYRKIRKNNLTNGCSINGVITACVYAACRVRGIPITQEDVIACSPAKNVKELRMCLKRVSQLGVAVPTTDAVDYVSKYSSALDLPQLVATNARLLINAVNQAGIAVGKNPIGVAAAALYIISKRNGIAKSQKDFSDACCITEVTIRQRCNEIAVAFGIRI
jgi:transcription initiation factor TFIIB